MTLLDVNILIYAHREDQADHEYFRLRLEALVREAPSIGLTPLTAGGFMRIVTRPNFPNGPTPLAQALAVVESLMQQPNVHWAPPGRRHWELLASLCRARNASGKAVADAQHAAIAIEHGGLWVSRDRDFEPLRAHGLRFERWEPREDAAKG